MWISYKAESNFRWYCFLFAFSTILGMALTSNNGPCWSAETPQSPKFVTIPIYYLTDRELLGETYGPHRRYPSHCEHHMYYGTAMVNVPNVKRESADELWGTLGWQASDRRPGKVSSKDRIDPADPDASKIEFFQRLKAALHRSGKPDLCVFVHGAADPFEDCLQDAADLAYCLQRPTVLYSWPSDPKRRGYFIDSSNSEWSQAHFNMFCKDLESFQSGVPLKVTFVSHSMGNRLVIRALPVLYGKGLVADMELISPDIDADTCRHYVMGYSRVHGTIRLYVSKRDKLLRLAQMLAGGYYRLGESADPLQKTPAVKADLLERIDFTAIDTGFWGHTIPFQLVANMIHDGVPGKGLNLVEESTVHAAQPEKQTRKSQGFKPATSEIDIYKRVVRVK